MLPLRKVLIGAALVVTLGLSLYDLPESAPEEVIAVKPRSVAVAKPVATPQRVQTLRARFDPTAVDLFAPRNWQPLPPPTPPTAVVAPKAPPLSLRYLGKALDREEIMVFVEQGARTHLLRKGDVLADYRVEQITAGDMTLVYLPLNEKQRLIFGSSN